MSPALRRTLPLAGVLAAALVVGVPAAAKPAAPNSATVVKDLKACRSIAAEAARLACYDQAVAALDKAEQAGDVVVLDQQQIREAKRDAFGFTMPSFSMFDRGDKPEVMDEITLTIDRAYRTGDGKWVIKTENGQTWRQVDTYELFKTPKKGSTIRIRKAALGSYTANVDGQKSIRVHRDD
jgi:hypothetical protein